jgi:2-aminobenzoate-CoA ligase
MNTAHIDRFVIDRLPTKEAQPDFLFDLPALRYPRRLNAAVALIDGGAADRLAVVNAAGRWTYREMAALSDRIARLLVEQEGLVPGNRVLLRGPNTAMMIAAWLGILKAGGVAVATMPILRAGEIAKIVDKGEISHAIVDSRSIEDFAAAAISPTMRSVLDYDGDAGNGALEQRLRHIEPGFDAVATYRDDPALIAFTSGTTGVPKGCVQFHRDILACADGFAANLLDPRPDDIWICSAPLAFTFGLGMQFIFPWRTGGAAATIETPGPRALFDAAKQLGATVIATAPTGYRAMLGMLADGLPPRLRCCVSAGENLPEAVWRDWHRATGMKLVNGIGATEMMHIFISASGDDIHPGTTGRAVPGYQAAILDDAGQPIAEGMGRLAVKGPTGCRYLDDPRQADYVAGGWNITGDIYRRDADGYFTYVGRADDMIVSSGYNIAAPEVEVALMSHAAVAECAVTGVPCPERGMQVAALIIAAPGTVANEDLADQLRHHVKASIAPYKYPRLIRFVDDLPRTPNGKVRRGELKALFSALETPGGAGNADIA